MVSNKNEESIDVGTDEEETHSANQQLQNTDEDTKSSEDRSPLIPTESNIQTENSTRNSVMHQN